MKKIRPKVFLVILVVMALTIAASLQQSPTVVIVNSQRVFELSNRGKQIQKMKNGEAGNKAVQKFSLEVIAVIKNMAEDRGYDLVLDTGKGGVVYYSPAVDISDEVIRRVDQTY